MNVLVRWGKFNAVGAIGVVVQLAALAALSRLWPGHYLIATAAAIELTLLHNFAWHLCWTWRDRRGRESVAAQCWRFHLSNGLVSFAGNLALMHLFIGGFHLPVLPANGIAILACSIINFCLADRWAFSSRNSPVRA